MYSGSGFSDWEIGDITVLIHNGVYHLFHLIIPNHDYIAHAISNDGISWKRVNNALFVGNPGDWDDDMLWTMHVCSVEDAFQMYYTGLQRKDRGVISKIGLAVSSNLIDWEKKENNIYPIEPKGIYYETSKTNPRKWLSFRDPYRFEYKGEVYLILCSRTITGPVSRRGCVGLVKIKNDTFELLPPLFIPRVYDDIECPCVFELNGRFYLFGSIREDLKIRYWFANDFFGEYQSFHLAILFPQGNYAARIVQDGDHVLVFNLFYTFSKVDSLRVLPPPKELATDDQGRLLLKSYYRWESMVIKTIPQEQFDKLQHILSNPSASSEIKPDQWNCTTGSGYEIFCFQRPSTSFIWEGTLTTEGLGKLGLVCDMDKDGNGYFISINTLNGLVELRAWGFNPLNERHNYIFNEIQSGYFEPHGKKIFNFKLLRYGHYFELSINGIVNLTLMDYTYSGNGLGLYSASASIMLEHSLIKILPDPLEEYASPKTTDD
ncbi:MAG: glycosyl hydrolase family 32 [Saprospiraceae bacterium]